MSGQTDITVDHTSVASTAL